MSDKLVKPAPQLPAHYKPEVGLKTVAFAEGLERHFRRAKDATRLLEAVELKLSEQRKYVLWCDRNGLRKGGGDRKSPSAIRDGDRPIERETLRRWRVRLKDEAQFQATLVRAQEHCLKVCEAGADESTRRITSGEIEWYTPPEYLDLARAVLGGFDLDPASSETAQQTVKASRYFTHADNGLEQEWTGRVWLNPPYQQPDCEQFVTKLIASCQAQTVTAAILLTNNSTDTGWFHHAASTCAAICFTRGRIEFLTSLGEGAGSPVQGQAFFYFGPHVAAFAHRFATTGFVVTPV